MYAFIGIVLASFVTLALISFAGLVPARAGVFDIGLEGKMVVGAFVSIAVTTLTESPWIGALAGVASGAVAGVLFWLLIDVLSGDPIIVGVGFATLGLGAAQLASAKIFATDGTVQAGQGLLKPFGDLEGDGRDLLGSLTVVGLALPVIVGLMFLIVHRSRFGIKLIALGELPASLVSAGHSPRTLRFIALLLGGALAGLAGAELALGQVQLFTPGMTAGRGFIALAAILVGRTTVGGTALAALFIAAADALAVYVQIVGWTAIPVELVLTLPYVLTIAAVCILGARLPQERSGRIAGT